jgi:hypothetical protein
MLNFVNTDFVLSDVTLKENILIVSFITLKKNLYESFDLCFVFLRSVNLSSEFLCLLVYVVFGLCWYWSWQLLNNLWTWEFFMQGCLANCQLKVTVQIRGTQIPGVWQPRWLNFVLWHVKYGAQLFAAFFLLVRKNLYQLTCTELKVQYSSEVHRTRQNCGCTVLAWFISHFWCVESGSGL